MDAMDVEFSAETVWPGLSTLERDISLLSQCFEKVVQDLKHERRALHQEWQKAVEHRRDMEQELARQWDAIREEKEQLGQMKTRVSTVASDAEQKVTLNVGGTPYETTLSTLTCDPDSMLAAMFSGKFHVDTQPDGSCFFDRDPKLFREVLLYLRWMRDSQERALAPAAAVYCPPTSEAEREGLAREAQYFGVDSLVKMLTHNVLEVSCELDAKYRRVSEALQDARDGDVIVVRPGLYMDSFTLNRSIPIQGDGQRNEIIIRSPAGNVVESRSKGGVIRNLTLEVGPVAPNGMVCGDYYCVLISAGSLLVENCEIRNAGLSCVKIVGDGEGSCPIIRGNAIHHANQCGILVTNQANGLIEHNDIFENRFSGIEIRNNSNPDVVGNVIHDNRQNGVYIHSSGSGKLERNTITNNNFNGINVEGPVVVRRNTVHSNSKRGIYHTPDTVLEDNDVQGNILGDVAPKR